MSTQDLSFIDQSPDGWAAHFAQRVEHSRQTARHAIQQLTDKGNEIVAAEQRLASEASQLDARRQQLAGLEVDLEARRDEFDREIAEFDSIRQSLEQALQLQRSQTEQFDRRRSELEQESARVATDREQLKREQQALDDCRAQLAAAQKTVDQRGAELEAEHARLAEVTQARSREAEEVQRQRASWDAERAGLDKRASELQRREVAMDEQRLRIAELQAEHTRQAADFERQRTELLEKAACQEPGLATQLSETTEQLNRVREELEAERARGANRQAELTDQQTAFNLATTELVRRQAAVDEARAEIARLKADWEAAQAGAQVSADEDRDLQSRQLQAELQQLREERDQLLDRLMHVQTVDGEQEVDGEYDPRELEELRERFEAAVQEIRQLKSQNAGLRQRPPGASSVPSTSGALDWEAQKRQLLAQLESDFDENDEHQLADKMTVEGAIHVTDQIVAEKDREIEELKQLLVSRSNVDDEAARHTVLDTDALILQERDKLKQLQQELHAKLRQAELDLSLERAKLARERTEIEEQIQHLESDRRKYGDSSAESHGKGKKGGRWLSRLGLKSDD